MAIEDPSWPRAEQWLARADPDPELVMVGVPTSIASLSPSAAWRAPARLRELLGKFSTFDGEASVELRSLRVADLGDWELQALDAEAAQQAIDARARALDPRSVKLFAGGDNAITRPLVRGLAGGALAAVGVLTLDAHHDVRTLERGPTNGTPIRGLFEDGLPDAHVAQIGIHSFANSAEYRRYCEERGVRVFTMREVDGQGIEAVTRTALEGLAARCAWIFVDFDMDVLDRAFAPACPGSRPGGLLPRQLFEAARICGKHPRVRAADFVEVDPERDPHDVTLMSMATTLLSFASGVAARAERRR